MVWPTNPNPRRPPILLFLLLCAIFTASQPATPPDQWSQFRGNRQLTGVSSSRIADQLSLLWTYQAGDPIQSSAAIRGGRVFVGTLSGELLSLGLEDGKVHWKYHTEGDGIGESSPAVTDELVLVGDLSGVVHAVAVDSGRRIWTFQTQAEIKSSPVVVGDRVLVGSYDEHLYCLSARDGKLVWKLKTEGPVHSTAGIWSGLACIAGCDEVFRAIQISDGQQIFDLPSGSYTAASPALSAHTAYYGTFNNEVIAVDLETRTIRWRYSHPERHFPFYSSPAVAAGKVIVGGRDKLLHCLDAETGQALWTFSTRARVESSPAVAGNRVYFGSSDGRFYVLDLESGHKVWEFNAGAPISASPAIAASHIVIGSEDGTLYCFR